MTRSGMFLRIIGFSLLRRRSRMLVALLAIAIGSTVFLGMGAVYYDIPRQMGREFRSYGANMVFVSSSGSSQISLADAARAAALLPAGKLVGLSPYRYEKMEYNKQPITIVGADFSQVEKTSPYWQIQGEWPVADDEILVGADISENARLYAGSFMTLERANEQGRKVSHEFKIKGVVRTGGPEDSFVLLPMKGVEKIVGGTGIANVVEASIAASGEELDAIAKNIQADVPEVTARPVKRIINSETTVLAKLQVLIYLVTAIVLFLTMICVGTTMMTVVMERRKEIGLKKAIGAENAWLMAEFLGEGAILAITGGLIGCVSGYFFAQLVSMSVFGRSVTLPLGLIVITVAASLIVTILASLLPVSRATDVEPALVLRGE